MLLSHVASPAVSSTQPPIQQSPQQQQNQQHDDILQWIESTLISDSGEVTPMVLPSSTEQQQQQMSSSIPQSSLFDFNMLFPEDTPSSKDSSATIAPVSSSSEEWSTSPIISLGHHPLIGGGDDLVSDGLTTSSDKPLLFDDFDFAQHVSHTTTSNEQQDTQGPATPANTTHDSFTTTGTNVSTNKQPSQEITDAELESLAMFPPTPSLTDVGSFCSSPQTELLSEAVLGGDPTAAAVLATFDNPSTRLILANIVAQSGLQGLVSVLKGMASPVLKMEDEGVAFSSPVMDTNSKPLSLFPAVSSASTVSTTDYQDLDEVLNGFMDDMREETPFLEPPSPLVMSADSFSDSSPFLPCISSPSWASTNDFEFDDINMSDHDHNDEHPDTADADFILTLPKDESTGLFHCPHPGCTASQARRYNLKIHYLTHLGSASKSFGCNRCERAFRRQFDLRRHMLSQHGVPLTVSKRELQATANDGRKRQRKSVTPSPSTKTVSSFGGIGSPYAAPRSPGALRKGMSLRSGRVTVGTKRM
ncbi:hypothetical protein HDU76_004752 [Blyttiomyces sp. JEL0837]|nr:hypothetical protein HDU76_004752 [Blyttiomyces sp. JEL0837]